MSGALTIGTFLDRLRWLDGRPLLATVEPYRRRNFDRFFARDSQGRPLVTLGLFGRGKKNAKTLDLCLACLFAVAEDSPRGSQVYLLANDGDQAADDLQLIKRLLQANPSTLGEWLVPKSRIIERRDGNGFIEVLPAQDAIGAHGKTFRLAAYDEIHGYRTWDIFEALQPDPNRPDAQQWVTSYASLLNRRGIPLFDLCEAGWAGTDPRMLFSWYSSTRTTDPDFIEADPETRANPSRASWADQGYLEQQRRRLPIHKFRRLHLNEPGLPEGAALPPELVLDAIVRGRQRWPPEPGRTYAAWCDMSGGSNDDATLAIGSSHEDGKGCRVDCVLNQGGPPPFDPRAAVERFAKVLAEYRCSRVVADAYAGQTFKLDFERLGITCETRAVSAHSLYEAFEPALNAREVQLPDVAVLEQQLLGLVWRGGKIGHLAGEHDDWAASAAGVVMLLTRGAGGLGGWAEWVMGEAEREQRRQESDAAPQPSSPPSVPAPPVATAAAAGGMTPEAAARALFG